MNVFVIYYIPSFKQKTKLNSRSELKILSLQGAEQKNQTVPLSGTFYLGCWKNLEMLVQEWKCLLPVPQSCGALGSKLGEMPVLWPVKTT